MKIVHFTLNPAIVGKPQPLHFQYAPRQCLGVFPGPVLKFLVDPTVPGVTCNAWIFPDLATNVKGSSLGTPNGGRTFVTSDCFA